MTIRDVAQVAVVSYRTVSRVINGHGSASAKAPARTAAPAAERRRRTGRRPHAGSQVPLRLPRPRTALTGMRGTLRRQRC
nr:LacI family DNA-binding transcriptional regulator [Streptomyces antimycoticus]